MIRAGVGLIAAPLVGRPAAHSIPAMMSESVPPHLPSTRTGRMRVFHASPATPMPLFVEAPIRPETRVPCHELEPSPQPAFVNWGCDASLAVTKSPGSD